jgi:hypothetical protein
MDFRPDNFKLNIEVICGPLADGREPDFRMEQGIAGPGPGLAARHNPMEGRHTIPGGMDMCYYSTA